MENLFETGWLLMPDEAFDSNPLFGPPPDESRFDATVELEAELAAAAPVPETLTECLQEVLEIAGVSRGMVAGQSLTWSNACNTSVKFEIATVEIPAHALWVEFKMKLLTGRCLRLRLGRYGEVFTLEDSAGITGNEQLDQSVVRIALDFAQAARQLMIRH